MGFFHIVSSMAKYVDGSDGLFSLNAIIYIYLIQRLSTPILWGIVLENCVLC